MDKLAELAKEEFQDVITKYNLMKELPEQYSNVLAHIINEEYQHGLEFKNIAEENGVKIDDTVLSKEKEAQKIMEECL